MTPSSATRATTGHSTGARHGKCMCGAVSFRALDVPDEFGACHCEMCRRWTGAALLAVTVPEGHVTFTGQQHIKRLQSSPWAERAWCDRCGSHLWYRVTDGGVWSGNYELPIGLFDDTSGMRLTSEIYHDVKPDAFSFADETEKMTRAEVFEKFRPGSLSKEQSNDRI